MRSGRWRRPGWALLALALLGFLAPTSGRQCLLAEVIYSPPPNESFETATKTAAKCNAGIESCVIRKYSVVVSGASESVDGFGCDNEDKCSGAVRTGSDLVGDYSFTCCSDEDLCNFNQVAAAAPPPAAVGRPDCGISAFIPKPWKDYTGGPTKIAELSGFLEKMDDPVDLRSKWTFGVQPPGIDSFILTRDTSSPQCYQANSFVAEGFCGQRTVYNENAEAVLDQFGDPTLEFDGKFKTSMCLGSKTEALALGNDFSLATKQATYEECQSNLQASQFAQECTQIEGTYNVRRILDERREILPDCCMVYIHMHPTERRACKCDAAGIILTPDCLRVCCCENALLKTLVNIRCPYLGSFIKLSLELEAAVERQCCPNRIYNQCHSRADCVDRDSASGFIEGLLLMPMCCDYCEDFYDSICSFPVPQDGGFAVISMKSESRIKGLKALCAAKGCLSKPPCAFAPF